MFGPFIDVPLIRYPQAMVCHDCPDAPCERDCLVPEPPFDAVAPTESGEVSTGNE